MKRIVLAAALLLGTGAVGAEPGCGQPWAMMTFPQAADHVDDIAFRVESGTASVDDGRSLRELAGCLRAQRVYR